MITTSKWSAVVAVAFVAGSFVASPELRAFAANTVRSIDIVDGEVKTADLGNNAVTSAKVKDGEIKSADIANAAVQTADIGSNSVNSAKIKDGEVMTNDIANDAVTSDKLADSVFDDLQAQIDALTAENAAQQTEIDDLTARVEALEAENVVIESILVNVVDNVGDPWAFDPILTYTATAFYSDGSSADVTSLAGWESLSAELEIELGIPGSFLCIADVDSAVVRATYEGQTDTELAHCV
jgi:hypothetical protein